MVKDEFKVKPTNNFISGSSSITGITDKQRNNDFINGKEIIVNKKELISLLKLKWCTRPETFVEETVQEKENTNG